ncbi:MAG: hypothetical protein U0169_17260 [Polyangiaceae bacterium]
MRIFITIPFILVGAFVAGCSGESRPTTGGGKDSTNATSPKDAGTGTVSPVVDAGPDAPVATSDAGLIQAPKDEIDPNDLSKKTPEVSAPKPGPAVPAACGRPEQAYDLTSLQPDGPPAFANAWRSVAARAFVPGLVLRLSKLIEGPVSVDIGSVHRLSDVVYGLDPRPITIHGARAQVDRRPSEVRIWTDLNPNGFTVSFIDAAGNRQGFGVASFQFDIVVDQFCENINDGILSVTIPQAAGPLVFGGSTMAELLGAPNARLDGSVVPNAWQVTWRGTSDKTLVVEP